MNQNRPAKNRRLFIAPGLLMVLVLLSTLFPLKPASIEADESSWPTMTPTSPGEVSPTPTVYIAPDPPADTVPPVAQEPEPTPEPETAPALIDPVETPVHVPPAPTEPPPPPPAQPGQMQQMRAFWATAYEEGFRNHAEVDELIANMRRANANTLLIQMRRHGDSWYNKSIEPRAADPGLAPPEEFDPLHYAIQKGHENGIKVHAWLVVSVACRDHDALRGHPDHVCTTHGPYVEGTESWTTVTEQGERVGDLDFGHPSAIHHMESVVTNLIHNYPDVDGIHFDFIRYTERNYGYNQVSVDRFNRAHGLPADNWPPSGGEIWSQWRRDRMTELMRRLYIRSKSLKPTIEMSIAAITWGGSGSYSLQDFQHSAAYARLFQDWQGWLQEGIIDFAVPMHYFQESLDNNRSWYNGWLAWDHQNTGRRAIVPGLGSWFNTPEENIAQAQRALAPNDQGHFLSGVAFYAYHHLFVGSDPQRRREFMDVLRNELFPEPAAAPEWPWITNPTTGMMQGMATIEGEVIPDAKVSLVKDGTWLRDIYASGDGWYGAVELEPGNYTIVVQDPASERKATVENVQVVPGYVAHAS